MTKLTLQALREASEVQGYEKCKAIVLNPDNWVFSSEFDTFLPFEYGYIDLNMYKIDKKYKRRLGDDFGWLYNRNKENDMVMVMLETSGRKRLDDKHWPLAQQSYDYCNISKGDRFVDGWHDTLCYATVKRMIEEMGFKVANIDLKKEEITIVRPESMRPAAGSV